MNNNDINIDELKSWIGNDEIVFDEVSENLEKRFRATLDIDPGDPQKGEIASSGIHWALAPAVVKSSLLGKDSHPQKGGFLPPVALPRRMWAGCQTTFLDTLKIGDQVKKRSSVIGVNLKNGKSGLLCFVKAKYEFYVDKKLVIEELHDIVYRDYVNNQATKVIKNDLPLSNPDFEEVIFDVGNLIPPQKAPSFFKTSGFIPDGRKWVPVSAYDFRSIISNDIFLLVPS